MMIGHQGEIDTTTINMIDRIDIKVIMRETERMVMGEAVIGTDDHRLGVIHLNVDDPMDQPLNLRWERIDI